ncbi:transposase [Photorhabdus bodei]|nr:transposase [Photorhabdus bodei]
MLWLITTFLMKHGSDCSPYNRLKSQGIKVIILYKSNEKAWSDGQVKFDHETYRRRNVVERCIGRLKEHRRIATRYEKTARYGEIRLYLLIS